MGKFKDLTGHKFGRLIVLKKSTASKNKKIYWKTLCVCGTESETTGNNLVSGTSQSCGCLALEVRTKHGKYKSKEYAIWRHMIDRCENKLHSAYKNYGGRGIIVCDRWKDINKFIEDMGELPSPNHSIERINNNLGYSKENCMWATRTQQSNNRRSNRYISYNKQTLTVAQWSRETRIKYSTILERIRRGWPISRALTKGSLK